MLANQPQFREEAIPFIQLDTESKRKKTHLMVK